MVKINLNVGDVFLSINPGLSGTEPHFHIVVHKTQNDELVVVHTTKEVEKVRQRCLKREDIKFDHIDPSTMIIINNSHCSSLAVESAIDCNKAQLKPQTFFIEKQYFKHCSPLSDLLKIASIKSAIKSSTIVEDYIKKLL